MSKLMKIDEVRVISSSSPCVPREDPKSSYLLVWVVTKRGREVIENTRSHFKKKSKLTNFMKLIRIEGYNGKYGSNPQGIREILDDLFEFDQIGQ